MTNRFYIEYQHATAQWFVFESNSHGLKIITACNTVETAASEMSLLQAIDGACKCAQNGLTAGDQIGVKKC